MKLLGLFLITLLFMIFISFYTTKERNYGNLNKIYFLIFTLCVPFYIGLGIHNTYRGVQYDIGMNYIFITILCVFITSGSLTNNNILTKVEVLFFIILIFIPINWFNNEIYESSRFMDLTIIYLTFYFLFVLLKNFTKTQKERILDVFSYVGIVNGILSIVQYLSGKKLLIGSINESILYTEGLMVSKRAVGLAGTNNAAGNLSAILFSVCMYNYIKNRKKKDLFAVILTLFAVILTLTRVGYLAIAIEIMIYFFISNWKQVKSILKKINIILFLGLPGIAILIINSNKIIDALFIQRGKTGSYRFIQFNNIINYLADEIRFFDGIGLGQYRSFLLNNFGVVEIDLHSQLINILVEQGIFIFIIFIIINVMILLNANKNADTKLKKAFLFSLFIGNLICSNFNPNQYYYINNVIYIILICSLTNVKNIVKIN